MLKLSPFAPSLGGTRAPSPMVRAASPVKRAFSPTAQVAFAVNASTGEQSSSVRVIRLGGGMVATVINLRMNSQLAKLLTDDILKPLQKVVDKMVKTAQGLSKGPLTLKRLADMGHPYGKGGKRRSIGRLTRMKGAVSLDVVNKQTGAFAAAWSGTVSIEPNGATVRLKNSNKAAEFLAFGTSKMVRHGPFSIAVLKHKLELDRVWRQIARMLRGMNASLVYR